MTKSYVGIDGTRLERNGLKYIRETRDSVTVRMNNDQILHLYATWTITESM